MIHVRLSGVLDRSDIPAECIEDCTRPGQDAYDDVAAWCKKLGFTVGVDDARHYLRMCGMEDERVDVMEDYELARWVLWHVCHDLTDGDIWCMEA